MLVIETWREEHTRQHDDMRDLTQLHTNPYWSLSNRITIFSKNAAGTYKTETLYKHYNIV